MTHEEMMRKAWEFIGNAPITDNKDDYEKDNNLWLVEDIKLIRDAYYNDLESGQNFEDEDLDQFLNRHNIEWK